jgi:hypothetical protein
VEGEGESFQVHLRQKQVEKSQRIMKFLPRRGILLSGPDSPGTSFANACRKEM